MSTKAIISLLVLVGLATGALAVSYPDGTYLPKPNVAENKKIAGPAQVVAAANHPSNFYARAGVNLKPAKSTSLLEALTGFTANVNFLANANNEENQAVNSANISTGITASKGPISISYNHSRNYARYVDGYTGYVESNFQGQVNNQITFSYTISPDYSDNSMNVSGVTGQTVTD